jgi:hypothetical protein
MKKTKLIISALTTITLFAFCFLFGCTTSGNDFDLKKVIEDVTGIYMTDEVTPENEHEFETIPFEKAVNPAFQKNLTGKLRFVAIYKGTAPDAEVKSSDHVSLKLCDPVQTDVCSDRIIIPERKSEVIFGFKKNQRVDVFGVISESSGIKVGGTAISHSQVGGLGVLTFFKVFGIRPVK